MSDDGLAALAVLSAKVRNEYRIMREGLSSLESKLVEYVGVLGAGSSSDFVLLESHEPEYGAGAYVIKGYLYFDGSKLSIVTMRTYEDGYEPVENFLELDDVSADWQRKLCNPQILQSLVKNTQANLDDDYASTAETNRTLSQFVTIEKAAIDSDLDELFSGNPKLSDSWIKARKSVETDPELSITLSCSHLETVLKSCLKSLGETGYQKDAIERLGSKVLDKLKRLGLVDEATSQMLRGVSTFFLGVATIRNAKSASHGKDDEYVPPTSDLAQTVNHLAGVASVFIMKQTNIHLKSK
ncbi:abortive infection family protein [Pseudomonas coronafaciens]|uniref:abortive infection family protein n=1 Tax=Pseudomonas coronafaciens TaxID=53409 RepID=UPI00378C5931